MHTGVFLFLMQASAIAQRNGTRISALTSTQRNIALSPQARRQAALRRSVAALFYVSDMLATPVIACICRLHIYTK
ncbi:hypothetical protein [Herbaspirillum sp. CF444]|uniref:hypothetical protein n=1 Tax=Herbaspirillum sp. CF444 TaxID=1144319 RepID=UPI0012FA8729|nr:hypothetical protein [Herbaspirillum sp. CF444]